MFIVYILKFKKSMLTQSYFIKLRHKENTEFYIVNKYEFALR